MQVKQRLGWEGDVDLEQFDSCAGIHPSFADTEYDFIYTNPPYAG